jgi:hypothetical protein
MQRRNVVAFLTYGQILGCANRVPVPTTDLERALSNSVIRANQAALRGEPRGQSIYGSSPLIARGYGDSKGAQSELPVREFPENPPEPSSSVNDIDVILSGKVTGSMQPAAETILCRSLIERGYNALYLKYKQGFAVLTPAERFQADGTSWPSSDRFRRGAPAIPWWDISECRRSPTPERKVVNGSCIN